MLERDLQLTQTATFRVNIENETSDILKSPKEDSQFFRYIKSALNEVSINTNGRKYNPRSLDTEVISVIIKIIKGAKIEIAEKIAHRLLREEVKVQKKIQHLGNEVHEGLLIQSHLVDKGVDKYIICKAENLDFIEGKNYTLSSGFPINRKIFRSVQIIFNSAKEITNIIVNDLNSKGATYWWDNFLEIDNQWDDIYNTTKAFEMINTKVFAKLKIDSPSDHTHLRNATIKYFRTNGEFELDSYIDQCIGNYLPVNETLDIEDIKNKVRELPEKFSFDKRFDLKPTEITARIKSTVQLNENIDLVIKKDIDIDRVIEPKKIKNLKYLLIRTDEGYNAFEKPAKN